MQLSEVLGGLVELDLLRLRVGDLLLELGPLGLHRRDHLLQLQVELLHLGLVRLRVLEQRQVVLLLLPCRERPLLELLLVPVHLQLELLHLLVALEHVVLYAVDLVLQLGDLDRELVELGVEPAALPLGQLLEVVLGLNLFDLGVDQPLRMKLLRLHAAQVALHHADPLLGVLELRVDRRQRLLSFAHLRMELLVFVVGEGGQVVELLRLNVELRVRHGDGRTPG
mmetsp:Transcript_16797/g.41617  ORF Transcript_16797/g.41617 Transcript_16797/m.41617 type:complete len:225 (+) Transcript_16797:1278-1952(+)